MRFASLFNCQFFSNSLHSFCRRVDIVIGGVPESEVGDFNASISYYSDDYTWCVQRAGYLSYAVSFFRLAAPEIWILIYVISIINGIVLFGFVPFDSTLTQSKFDIYYTTFLIAQTALTGQSPRFDPKHTPLRLFYLVVLFSGMIFFQLFFCNLVSHGNARYRKDQTDSVAKIVADEFRLAGTASILKRLQTQPIYSQQSLGSFETCNDMDECLAKLADENNYDLAVGVSRLHAMHSRLFQNHNIFCFRPSENIENYSISLAIRGNVELVSRINRVIRGALEGGLIAKWERENAIRVRPENDGIVAYQPWRLETLLSVFYFCLFAGFALGFSLFLFEHYVAYEIGRPQSAKKRIFWSLMEKAIDGRRHVLVE